jgi:predicted dehydrogenase
MVGAGHIHAPSYLRCLRANADVKVVGVYDPDPETARRLAGEVGVAVLRSPEECSPEANAVVVCCEPTRQLRLVRLAAQAGLPTLCEKPFGTTPDEAETMLELARRVPISVTLPVRYHPAAMKLRAVVQQGALGTMPAVWATNRNSFPGGWFADPALAGGGCLLDHVVHVADLLRWIWGTEYSSVTAEAGVFHTPGLQMEDTAIVLLECTNGMIVTIDPSMSRPRGMPGALDLVMEVWGAFGRAKLDVFAEIFESVDGHGSVRLHSVGHDMDSSMIDAWVRSVRSDEPPPVPALDGFAATSLAFAAQRAALTHQTVLLSNEEGGASAQKQ